MTNKPYIEIVMKYDAIKEWLKAINSLVDETKICINKNGLYAKTVDTAHVAMVESYLDKSCFESFTPSKNKEYIGVDVEYLIKYIGTPIDTDIISMGINKDLTILSLNVDGVESEICLEEPDVYSDAKIPNLNLPVKASMSSEKVKRMVKELEPITDHILFSAKEGEFQIIGYSSKINKRCRLQLEKMQIVDKKTYTSMFPLDYMSNILRLVKTPWITLWMGQDYPVKIEFEQKYGVAKHTFILAPRVESEDGEPDTKIVSSFEPRKGRSELQMKEEKDE